MTWFLLQSRGEVSTLPFTPLPLSETGLLRNGTIDESFEGSAIKWTGGVVALSADNDFTAVSPDGCA